jgi:TetR/AcrR family transcriptional regulator, cholesterol catabolism regulator
MSENQDIKIKILQEAETLFMKFGFKSITMDDISRELGISKKTLYQYFEDKNDLVSQTMKQHLEDQKASCKSLDIQNFDPITYMLNITDSVSNQLRQITPGVIYDLKKYFKPTWDSFVEFKTSFVYQNVLKNLETGQSKGFYHKDVDVKLIANLYVHLIDFLVTPEFQHTHKNFKELHFEIMKYHLRGICTEKGLKILNEKLKEYKQ